MTKPITNKRLAQLDELKDSEYDGEITLPNEDYDALRERLRLAEAVVKAAEYHECTMGCRICKALNEMHAHIEEALK